MKKMLSCLSIFSVILISLFINISSAQAATAIPVGSGPTCIAVNKVTNKIYAVSINTNTVSVIDGSTDVVTATIAVGELSAAVAPGIVVNPNTNTVYVTNTNSNTISVINGATNNITATIPVGSGPVGLAVNTNTNTIYATNSNDNSVSVINGTTNTVITTITVGAAPYFAAVNDVTNTIYVTNYYDHSVSVINGSTNNVTATITGNLIYFPVGVTVNSSTNTIYVANYNGISVSVINGETNNVVTTAPLLSDRPWGVDLDTNSNILYIAGDGGYISLFSCLTNTVVAQYSLSYAVIGVAVNNVTNKFYATSWSSGEVYVCNRIPVVSVSITPDYIDLEPTATTQLVPNVLPSEAINKDVTYTSSDQTIATVSPTGLVTAVSEGIATITVTTLDGGFTATSTINVVSTPTITVTSVSLTPDSIDLAPTSTTQLTPNVLPYGAINKDVTYTSSDPTIATVSTTGLVTAVSGGTATITVTTLDGGFMATSTINVVSPPTVPTDIQSSSVTSSNITLYWPQVPGNTEYYIYRDGIFVGTSPVSTYTDPMLSPSTLYSYTVSALNISGASAQSLPLIVSTNEAPNSLDPIIAGDSDPQVVLCSPDGKSYYDPIDKKEKELKAPYINNQSELNSLTNPGSFIIHQ